MNLVTSLRSSPDEVLRVRTWTPELEEVILSRFSCSFEWSVIEEKLILPLHLWLPLLVFSWPADVSLEEQQPLHVDKNRTADCSGDGQALSCAVHLTLP